MHFLGNSPPVTLSGPTPSWKLHEGFNTRFENLSSLLDERWDVIKNKISKSSSLHLKHMRLTWQIISGVLIGEWLLFDKLFKTGLHKPVSDVTAATSKSGCWSFLASFSFCSCLFLLLSQGNEALQAYIFQNIGSTNVMWQQINIGTDISKCHFTVNITVSVRADFCSWIRAIILGQSEVKYRTLLYYLKEQGLSPRCVRWKLACCIFKRGRQPKCSQSEGSVPF